EEHYSDTSISNATGSDGRMYGVPKDKDNICLVYNKEMFDAAGVAYPDETWTWDDLESASQAIYDATGNYGYMAYNDEQLGYHNFVYQNGCCLLVETALGLVLGEDAAAGLVDEVVVAHLLGVFGHIAVVAGSMVDGLGGLLDGFT